MRLNAVGSLPSGCAIVATVNRATIGGLGNVADGLLGTASQSTLPGLDLRRSVRRITFCRMAGRPTATSEPATVFLLSGPTPAELLLAASRVGGDVGHETIDGIPVMRRALVWMAERGQNDKEGEVVVASDRELLRATLTGSSATYSLDPQMALSIVLNQKDVQQFLIKRTGSAVSPLAVVQEIRIGLLPSDTTLVTRFVIGDGTAAGQFADAIKPALTTIVGRALGGEGPRPDISIDVEDRDVVARVNVPPDAMTTLTNRITAAGMARVARR